MKQQRDNKGKFLPKQKPTFFEKYAVNPVKDQVSQWLSNEESTQDNKLIDLVDAHRKNLEQGVKVPSDQLMAAEQCTEPKKPKRKPTKSDLNYLSQDRSPNGRFGSKKSSTPIFHESPFHVTHDKVTAYKMMLAVDAEIKESQSVIEEPTESFSKLAILAGNYVKSVKHDPDAKYTANDIREALIWGLNNHGGTLLPSKKATLYMRNKGIS